MANVGPVAEIPLSRTILNSDAGYAASCLSSAVGEPEWWTDQWSATFKPSGRRNPRSEKSQAFFLYVSAERMDEKGLSWVREDGGNKIDHVE